MNAKSYKMKTIKKLSITVSCVLTICGIVAGSHGSTPAIADECESIRHELKQLRGLIQRKKFIEKALQKCENDSGINYFYAYNLDRRGKPGEALKYYRIAIAQDRNNSNAFLGMGDIYLASAQPEKAIEAYENGLLADPGNKLVARRLNAANNKYGIHNAQSTVAPAQVKTSAETVVQVAPEPTSPVQPYEEPVPPVEDTTDPVDQVKSDAPEQIADPPAIAETEDSAEIAAPETTPNAITPPPVAPQDLLPLPETVTKKQIDQPEPDTAGARAADKLTTVTNEDLTIITGFSSDILALIQFKTGKHKLNEDTREFIKSGICKSMNEEVKTVHFEVVGHTDDLGTLAVNQKISLKRARAIGDLLAEECKISSNRLHVVAYGKSQPMVPNITPENREENRRVEIKRIQKN